MAVPDISFYVLDLLASNGFVDIIAHS